MSTDPLATFIILLVIGIAAGLIFERMVGSSWFTRQVTGSQRRMVTSALVGIAGSFVGYHLFALLGVVVSGNLGFFLGAIICAAAVLWGWRQIRS
jgi:uncharacterized membrane protein YeaQ/YmgE (transglycosylase-associated protein family)